VPARDLRRARQQRFFVRIAADRREQPELLERPLE